MKRPYETLTLDVADSIAKVTFNREKDTNPFSRTMTPRAHGRRRRSRPTGSRARPHLRADPHGRHRAIVERRGRLQRRGGALRGARDRAYLGEIVNLYIAILRVESRWRRSTASPSARACRWPS